MSNLRNMVVLVGLALAAAGCMSTDTIRPLTNGQVQSLMSRAKDPRQFWLTTYEEGGKPYYTGANRMHPGHASILPFEGRPMFSSREICAPLVKMTNPEEHDSAVMLLDTSSSGNWLGLSAAERLDWVPLGPPFVADVPGHVKESIPGYLGVVGTIRFDLLFVETALFYARGAEGPLGVLSRRLTQPQPDGVLGWNLLKCFRTVQIDFPKRHAVLLADVSCSPSSSNLIAVIPQREVGGALAADGMLDGKPQVFLLDTAGDYELAMDQPPSGTIRQVSLGDVVFRSVAAVDARDAGLSLLPNPRIGRRLLGRFRLTLDNGEKQIIFEKP